MKKLLFSFLLVTTISFNSQAQWVSIPDTNFGTWLDTSVYSVCMQGNSQIGWQMDTTCSTLVNGMDVDCRSSNISDLTGIQYFDRLRTLYCQSNQLTTLPSLPSQLRDLNCSGNPFVSLPPFPNSIWTLNICCTPLTSLPNLPSSLISLYCYGGQLTTLPAIPNGVSHIQADYNQFTSLPPLPNSIRILYVNGNQLTSLPALPTSLQELYCHINQLTSLPTLTPAIERLSCYSNQLTSLPTLPASLISLACDWNQLTSLPTLPNSLYGLNCSHNQITSLPQLPNSLRGLTCTHNLLTSIPELPDTLQQFNCNDNPYLACMPRLKKINTLYFYRTAITCVSNYGNVINSFPDLDTIPLCQLGNPNGCISDSACFSFQIDSIITTDVSCFGGSDGSVCVYASGGTPGYAYAWSNGSTNVPCAAGGLPAGSYAVFISDANSCSVSASAIVTEPTQLTIQIVSATGGLLPDTLSITGSGGSLPVTFLWSNGFNLPTGNVVSSGGSYSVTVWDSHACTASDTITVGCPGSLQINSITTTDPPCYGMTIYSSITINASGGTPPYSYPNQAQYWSDTIRVWGSGNGGNTLNLERGTGIRIGMPVSGTGIASGSVVTGVSGNAITISNTIGWVQTTLTFTGVAENVFMGMGAGSYPVLVVDANSCSVSGTAIISQPDTMKVDSVVFTNATCNGANNGNLCVYTSGGTPDPDYHYTWSFWTNDTVGCLTNLAAGWYTTTITDGVFCTAIATVNITEPPQLISAQIISATGGELPDTLCPSITSVGPFTSVWAGNGSLLLPSQCYEVTIPGIDTLMVTDSTGCETAVSFIAGCSASCVWPGDADNNGIADNNDLLPIGLVYGSTGFVRPVPNINWNAHRSADWADTVITYVPGQGTSFISVGSNSGITVGMHVFGAGIGAGAVVTNISGNNITLSVNNTGMVSGLVVFTHPYESNGTNYKHIDCNGNGTINADDTLAIMQNFGLTHAKNEDERGWRMSDPALYVDLIPDTTAAGDTMYANIILANLLIPASNVYGLAFTLNYDASVVDSSKTTITFGNSWLGNATDKISIAKDFKLNGQIKCAITRIDHTTRSGSGQIGQAKFVITTDNINGKDLSYYQFDAWISDLTVIDNLGNEITVNEGSDSSQIGFEPLSVGSLQLAVGSLKILPNPASNECTVRSMGVPFNEVNVLNVLGEVVLQYSLHQVYNAALDVSRLDSGVYFVRVATELGTYTRRLVINR